VRGSGLGLYISRQLVEAMHGQIWVESSGKPGEGSCFCFTLPSAAQPASEERPNTDGLSTQDEPWRSPDGSSRIEPRILTSNALLIGSEQLPCWFLCLYKWNGLPSLLSFWELPSMVCFT